MKPYYEENHNHEGEAWQIDPPDPSNDYPDLRDLEIHRLRVALEGHAIPRLEFAAARFRELANDATVAEPWRNACSLWSMITNHTLETIASAVREPET